MRWERERNIQLWMMLIAALVIVGLPLQIFLFAVESST